LLVVKIAIFSPQKFSVRFSLNQFLEHTDILNQK
jgi:hypothetical protein